MGKMEMDLLKLINDYGRACRRDGSPAWESDEGQALKAALESRARNAGGAVAWQVKDIDGNWARIDKEIYLRMDGDNIDFQEGQWWVKELDALGSTGTDDQKRAIAVVHHMLRSARAALATAQTDQWLSVDEARLALWTAIQAVTIGNKTDDKLILNNLRGAGLWIGKLAAAPAKPEGV